MRPLIVGLVCLCLLGLAPARAATNDPVRAVSAEDAKRLVDAAASRLALDDLTTLAPEAAVELARHNGWLSLGGLAEISDAAAAALAEHKGPLSLDGLKSLSDAAAASLARNQGELSLAGLPTLSDAAAKALAEHKGGRLVLNGVTTLSPAAATALAQRKGGNHTCPLRLQGLTTLSVEAAEALGKIPGIGWDGRILGMKTITADVARALAQPDRPLSLEGLTALPDDVAAILMEKRLTKLNGLTELSPQAAKALAATRRDHNHAPLFLNGLKTLPDEVATELQGATNCDLHLDGLTSLSPAAARAISQRSRDLYLNGLKTIPDDTLQALAEHRGNPDQRFYVFLDGLTAISGEGAQTLVGWPKWRGTLPGITSLDEKGAAALAASTRWDGALPALAKIDAATAKALAGHRGNLRLDGLTTLTPDVAKVLAEHRGGELSLDGLGELPDALAPILAGRPGRLSLDGLKSLSPAAAQALAAHEGDWLFLDGVTTLSNEAADEVAKHRGVVSLLGLPASDVAVRLRRANPRIALADAVRAGAEPGVRAAAAKPEFVVSFLESTCGHCHDADTKEGDFELTRTKEDGIAGRVAYASVLERLRAGDMPPESEDRPSAEDVAGVIAWIEAELDSPLPAGGSADYAVKERPVDGNRLPHAILFGGPRQPSVPPPPRLWRLSPAAYSRWLASDLRLEHGQQPFSLIQEPGIRDFSALYAPDEAATGLLLANAEQVVATQCQAAGNGPFAPLVKADVRPSAEELEKAIRHQFQTALHRQPTDPELASLRGLYDEVAGEGDLLLAGQTVLMAPLVVPDAVMRFEIGTGPEVRPGVHMLQPREAAVALSLALSTRRQASLIAAADEGKLGSRKDVAEVVRRCLDDPQTGKSRVLGFFREFLDYPRATDIFKDPPPKSLTSRGIAHDPVWSIANGDLLILHILAHDKDVLGELLTTRDAPRAGDFVSAEEYLWDGPGGNSRLFQDLSPIQLEEHSGRLPPDRIGLPMHTSWLLAWSTNFHNDIVRRGRWVRERLLGGRVPDLPINAAAMVPEDPHHTLRERQMVTRAEECWKCHVKMDDLGLPFEDTNHYGVSRTAEEVVDLEAMEKSGDKNAKIYRDAPLDTTGLIRFSGEPTLDGPVRNAPEMLRRLAASERVRQVFVRHAFRYFLGRNETPGDALTLQEADKAYVESGGSFKALLTSLLSSESFLYRSAPAANTEAKEPAPKAAAKEPAAVKPAADAAAAKAPAKKSASAKPSAAKRAAPRKAAASAAN